MEKKISCFFLLLIGLLWNPLTVYWLYQGTVMAQSKSFLIVSGVVLISSLAMRFAFKRDKWVLRKWMVNLIFGTGFSVVVFFFVLVGNRMLYNGSQVTQSTGHSGLIFEPNSVGYYNTIEYNCKAQINSIGLRNKEINVVKDNGTKRILCFGDSWTFGWGVEEEFSWPNQLGLALNSNGDSKYEVINAGQGGQYTKTYKKYLTKAVPMLKPDIVLVGVLQIDDLAQIHEGLVKDRFEDRLKNGVSVSLKDRLSGWFANWLKASIGNYQTLILKTKSGEVDIKKSWRESSNQIIEKFDYIQMMHFQMLSPEVQSMFKTGDLNPGLIQYYVSYPDRYAVFNNPNNTATKEALIEMNKDFQEMKMVCDEHGAKLIFVSMPTNNFTGHIVDRTPLDELNPYLEKNNRIDSMYASVASNVGIPFIENTTIFRGLTDKSGYFYKYDGHPNKAGYLEIANNIKGHLLTMAFEQ